MSMVYEIQRIAAPELSLDWDGPAWRQIPPLSIDQFHPASSDHRPQVHAKLSHSGDALCAIFRVRDRYVKSLNTQYQQMVCNDSCVELFLQPKLDRGYFNFEINCGGAMLLYCIEDPTFISGSFRKFAMVAPEHAANVQILTTMPKTTALEIEQPIEWRVALRIPVAILESYVGTIGDLAGQQWRGNLYKCGDATSHPHWASWSPIGAELNFHQPEKFGALHFA